MATSLGDDKEVNERIQEAWGRIFLSSNQILAHAKRYGFTGIERFPSPNIHKMLHILREIDTRLAGILGLLQEENSPESADEATQQLDHRRTFDSIGKIVDAREQILKMELVAAALRANDKEAFESAIEKITIRPVHKMLELG